MRESAGDQERLACLVVAHNLGDAVIQSGFMRKLVASDYAKRYLVWTRPQVAFLFSGLRHCDLICSQFPVGTSKQMGGAAVFTFLQAAWQVRWRRPSVTIDLIGDLRDRLFAYLAGSPRHLHIGWEPGHPFRQQIRNPFGSGDPLVEVPCEVRNVYAAYDLMLSQLLTHRNAREAKADGQAAPTRALVEGRGLRVGLHPFASQQCKLWPVANWRRLAVDLLDHGAKLVAFGAPTERGELSRIFSDIIGNVQLATGDMQEFAKEVAGLDVLVGLDSFAVHMAQRQGIHSVLINAGNPPDLWAPPDAAVLAHSGGCAKYPCSNVPRCEGTASEYICVKAVRPDEALSAVLERGGR